MQAARLSALGKLEFDEPDNDPDEQVQDAAAAFGLLVESCAVNEPEKIFFLWPECLPVWLLWLRLQTQWRYGAMGGPPTGLDYAAVLAFLRAQGYSRSRQKNLAETFDDLAAMERSALAAWAEQNAMSKHG